MRKVICPYCGEDAYRVPGTEIYPHRPDLADKHFWLCSPCNAYVGCHRNSDKPLGRLANQELRRWKRRAHEAFDPLWKYERMSRAEAYRKLAEAMKITPDICHIGMFDVEQCQDVVFLVKSGVVS